MTRSRAFVTSVFRVSPASLFVAVVVTTLIVILGMNIDVICSGLAGLIKPWRELPVRPETTPRASAVVAYSPLGSVKANNKGGSQTALATTDGQVELNTLRLSGVTYSLRQVQLNEFTEKELIYTVHSYLDNTNTICKRKLRMGKIGDGGWEICDDLSVRPQPPCLIYSFGIGSDFSFDDSAATLYKCHVFSFDPTVKTETHNRSRNVHFYNIGISGRTFVDKQGNNFYTFSDIRSMLQHQGKRVNVVKMDVEGSEWDSLPDMIGSKEMSYVDQLLVEYHIHSLARPNLLSYLRTVRAVELSGFRIFYTHKNAACKYDVPGFPIVVSQCLEVHYKRE